jgi:penicillin-binding protein 2
MGAATAHTAADGLVRMTMSDDNWRGARTPTRNRPHGNLVALRIAVVALFVVLALQLFRMQIVDGADYARRSRENHIVEKYTLATRGLIYDRNGEPIVENVPVYTAVVLPEFLPVSKDARYAIYLRLERLVGVPALEIQARVDKQEKAKRGYIEIPVQKYLTPEQALKLEEASTDMDGVSLSIKPGRRYIAGDSFAHILGYIGDQDKEDVDRLQGQGYAQNEPIGKDGVELTYEKDLRGSRGVTAAEQDAQGHLVQSLKSKDPVPGNGLRLSIDAGLQQYTAELLMDSLPGDPVNGDAKEAAAVVMDARTGEILALVSVPSFDNNIFNQPDRRAGEYEALATDTNARPLLNKALSAAAPGSTFKLVTAAAALETGRITPGTTRNVTSTILLVRGENGQAYPLTDWRVHGVVDLYDAIKWSSNIYFFQASCGILGESKGLGKDDETSATVLGYYAKQFGFGKASGIDIPGEADGRVPDPAWKARVHAPDNPEDRLWYYADTCFMGIGQGDMLATPLQVARMTAAVANGGHLLTPHVVKEVLDQEGKVMRTIKPESKDVPVKPQYLRDIREGMHRSVAGEGAGALAQVPGLDVAGKTGTAEFTLPNGKTAQHAWFTGYAPWGDPQVVVTVYFDRGVGGEKAAPIAAKILDYWNNRVKR